MNEWLNKIKEKKYDNRGMTINTMGIMDLVISSLIQLLKDDFADRIYDAGWAFGVAVWEKKWNDIPYGYKCDKRRIDVDELRNARNVG